jgi:hypothetical protein
MTAPLEKLMQVCNAPEGVCRDALKHAKGDVDEAVRHLVIGGAVRTDDLNPASASLIHYAFADLRQLIANFETMDPTERRVYGGDKKIPVYRAQLVGKKPVDPIYIELAKQTRQMRLRELRRRAAPPPTAGVVRAAPFPPLTYKETGGGAGNDRLPGLAVFRLGKRTAAAAARVSLHVERTDAHPSGPAPEQVAAYAHLKEHQAALAKIITAAVADHLEYENTSHEIDPSPKVVPAHMSVDTVYVTGYAKAGHAYLFFTGRQDWSGEGRLNIIMHRNRVVDIHEDAPTDTPIEDDGGRAL